MLIDCQGNKEKTVGMIQDSWNNITKSTDDLLRALALYGYEKGRATLSIKLCVEVDGAQFHHTFESPTGSRTMADDC